MDVFDLRILRLALELGCGGPFQVYVEESADVVCRQGNLAPAIEAHNAYRAHRAHHKWTLQHRAVVRELVVTRTSDHDHQPAVTGQPIVNGVDVRSGLADRLGLARIRLASVVAQEKHERLGDTIGDNTAEGSPIHIDASLAPGIVMAELQGRGATKRVAEHSDPLHIEPSQEPARGV